MLSKLVPNFNLRDHTMTGRILLNSDGSYQDCPAPGEKLYVVIPEIQTGVNANEDPNSVNMYGDTDSDRTSHKDYSTTRARDNISCLALTGRNKIVNAAESLDKAAVFDTILYKQNFITVTASKDANWDGIDIVKKEDGHIISRQLPSNMIVTCKFVGGKLSHGIASISSVDMSDEIYDRSDYNSAYVSLNTSTIYSGDIEHKTFDHCEGCDKESCDGCSFRELSDHVDNLITILQEGHILGEKEQKNSS